MTTSGSGQAGDVSALSIGQLVVVPGRPELGLGRLERFVREGGQPEDAAPRLARVWLYQEGRFLVCDRSEVTPAPPGVWPPQQEG